MKKIILGLGLICLIFLMGCEGIDVSKISDEDMARIAEKAIVCDKPYIRFGSSCCLDENDNDICDNDEQKNTQTTENQNIPKKETEVTETPVSPPPSGSSGGGGHSLPGCVNECSESRCVGYEWYDCLTQISDGCKDEVKRGITKNKCGVECISNNDCKNNEECKSNRCSEKICTYVEVARYCDGNNLKADVQNTDCSIKSTLIEACHICEGEAPNARCKTCQQLEIARYCKGDWLIAETQKSDCSIEDNPIRFCFDGCVDDAPHASCAVVE